MTSWKMCIMQESRMRSTWMFRRCTCRFTRWFAGRRLAYLKVELGCVYEFTSYFYEIVAFYSVENFAAKKTTQMKAVCNNRYVLSKIIPSLIIKRAERFLFRRADNSAPEGEPTAIKVPSNPKDAAPLSKTSVAINALNI